MKIRTKLGIGFGTQILVTTVLGISALTCLYTVNHLFGHVVNHNASVIANARHLSKLIIDMETGQRGFCLTHKDEFLEPYIKGDRDFNVLIKEEKKLISGNTDQVAALERIEHLVHQWKEKAAEPEIAMARKASMSMVDAEHLQEILRRGEGKAILDQMRGVMLAMEASFKTDGNVRGEILTSHAGKAMVDQETGQRGFLITGDDEFLEPFIDGKKAFKRAITDLRKLNSHVSDVPAMTRNIDRLEKLATEWLKKAAEPEIACRRQMNAHPETQKDVAAMLELGTGKAFLDEIRREFDEFIEIETRKSARDYSTANETTAWTRNFTAGLLFFAICLGVIVAGLIDHAISVPLEELTMSANAVGSGDLGQKVDIKTTDEIGELAQSFNEMLIRLQEVQQDLRQSETKYRKLYDSTFDAVMLLDEKGFFDCNDASVRMFGCKDKAEFCEKHPVDLSPVKQSCGTDSLTLANQQIATAMERGCNLFEWTHTRLDTGRDFPAEVMLSTIELDGLPMLQALVRDISERKQGEQALRQAERLSALSTLAAGIAHEINNPIGSATLATEIALTIKDNPAEVPQLEQCLNNIAVSMDRCGQIIKKMLVFSVDDPSAKETGNINDAIQQSLHLTQGYATKHQTQVTLELDYDLPPMNINLLDMELVIINLIKNAIEATDTGGKVAIRSLAVADGISVSIEDDGCGMNEEETRRLFEPFFTTRQNKGGTGLGCSIVHGIIKEHGGTVHVESDPGVGTTLTITLPVTCDSLATEEVRE